MNTARRKLCELVASSAAFQNRADAADETAALGRVYSPTAPDDYTAPCSLVLPATQSTAGMSGHANHDFEVVFELPVEPNVTDVVAFANLEGWAEDVRREMMRNQFEGGRLLLRSMTVIQAAARGRRRGGGTPGETNLDGETAKQDLCFIVFGVQSGLSNPP